MTTADEALDALDHMPADDDAAGTVLPSFAVQARFRREAESAEQAEAALRRELEPVRDLFDDLRLEPREPDGRWAVDVRFVVVSVDNESAVEGVHRTLGGAGLTPDETWVSEQLP